MKIKHESHDGAWPIPGDGAIDTWLVHRDNGNVSRVTTWSNYDGTPDISAAVKAVEEGRDEPVESE